MASEPTWRLPLDPSALAHKYAWIFLPLSNPSCQQHPPTPPPGSRLGLPPQPHSLGTSVSGGPKEQSMGWRGTRGGSLGSQARTPLWGSLTVHSYLSRLRFPPFPRQLHSWHERVKSACPRQPMAARSAFAAPPDWRMHRVGGEEAPVPWDALKRLWLGSRATLTRSPRP